MRKETSWYDRYNTYCILHEIQYYCIWKSKYDNYDVNAERAV